MLFQNKSIIIIIMLKLKIVLYLLIIKEENSIIGEINLKLKNLIIIENLKEIILIKVLSKVIIEITKINKKIIDLIE